MKCMDKPCSDCRFRKEAFQAIPLVKTKIKAIERAGKDLVCHKTNSRLFTETIDPHFCAGARIMLGLQENTDNSDIFKSFDEMYEASKKSN